uniref:NADH-ubiquinone oxidoreductase chain 4L n=1 Tax=Hydropsyche fryeri TaxID=1875497 RepID=A0A8A9WFQ5_9NEOP|nr:NADH dehydrogenase subunit 4L [Hydropsyche fryeri]QTT57961.1 NADH dehydrogenase subunit 4L [Hydropsyche fryeri]
MIMFNILISFLFILVNFMLVIKRKHLLNMLLVLEFLMLLLFLFMFLIFMNIYNEFYFLMMFMVFMVSEGVLGITILVMLIRNVGSDYFYVYNFLMC